MSDQTVTLRITANTDGLVEGARRVRSETKSIGEEAQRAGKQLGDGIGGGRHSMDQVRSSAARLREMLTGLGSSGLAAGKQLGDGFESARNSLDMTGRAAQSLKGFLGGLAAAFVSIQSVRAVASMADEWSDLTSQVRVNIGATEDASAVMERLSRVARGTYSSLQDTAKSFAQNASTLNALGKSTQEQLDYATALNNALIVSGAKGQQFAQVQDALVKAMALGALRGDELNTVLSRGSAVAEALADELGVSVLELRKLGEQGKITGDVVFAALTRRMTEMEERAASMPATISDAMTLLRNSLLEVIGYADDASGATGGISEALIDLADVLSRPEVKEGFAAIATGAVNATIEVIKLFGEVRNLVDFMGRFAAMKTTGWVDPDDIELNRTKFRELSDELIKLQNGERSWLAVTEKQRQARIEYLRKELAVIQENAKAQIIQQEQMAAAAADAEKAAQSARDEAEKQRQAALDALRANVQNREEQGKTRQATDSARQAAESYLNTLRSQAATYGMTEEAKKRVTMGTLQLTEAQRAEAEYLIELMENWRRLEASMEPAHRALENLSRGHDDLDKTLDRNADALAGLSRHQIEYNAAMREQNKLAAEAAMLGPLTADQYAELEERMRKLGEILEQEISLAEMAEETRAAAQEAQELESILRRFDDIGFNGLVRDMDRVKKALEEATDPAQVKRLERALAELRHGMVVGVVGTAQDGLRSLQSMASEGSDAFRAMQTAIDALTVVQAISAILNQGNGDPYTAFARMAAMAAAVSQLVGNLGSFQSSFADTAAQRQATQGTGTVLGDADAKSESIARATEITAHATQQLVGINRGMLRALQNMEAGIGSAAGMMARGAGNAVFSAMPSLQSFGALQTPIAGALGLPNILGRLLGGSAQITDQGIVLMGGLLSDMVENIMVGAYQEVQYRRWRFGNRRTREEVVDVTDALGRQFELILGSIIDTVREGALALGLLPDEIEAALASFRLEEIRISTQGLSAEEQQAELAAVFSSIFDGLAGHVVPFIEQFQRVGEGLGETLVRVATSVQVTQEAVTQLGFALDETDPERLAQISVGLVELAGGIDEFIGGMSSFMAAFAPDDHRFAVAQDALTRAFEQFGLSIPPTREAMWALMQSLDATTESGREQIAMLLRLADTSDAYYRALEDRERAYADFINQFRSDEALPTGANAATLDQAIAQSEAWVAAMVAQAHDLARAAGLAGASEEDLALIHQRAAENVAAAASRIAGAQRAYADFIDGIAQEAGQMSRAQAAMAQAYRWQEQAVARAHELARAAGLAGASERALALIELRAAQMRAAAMQMMREETQSLIDQLYGSRGNSVGQAFSNGITQASNAAADYWEQQRRAAVTLQDYLDSMLLGDLSALTPAEQLAEAWEQLNAAVNSGDADAATRLADVYLRLLRNHEASGADYNAGFWQVRELLQGMLDAIGPIPDAVADAGGDGGGYITAAGAERIAAQNRMDLAVQLARHLADLSEAVGQTVYELMAEMGVDLRTLAADLGISLQNITGDTVLALVNMADLLGSNLIELTEQMGLSLTDLGGGIRELAEQTGINLDALTVESTQALGALANRLGVDLSDIARSVGVDLGHLADAQSLLNAALANEIEALPDEYREAMRNYYENIVNATNEADANEAIGRMSDYINELAPDIRTQLAPYFADVFPAEALNDLDYLTSISASTAATARATEAALDALGRIAGNLRATNAAAGVPSYDVGTGYVPRDGMAMIHKGEAIIPAPFNAWLRQHGFPTSPRGATSASDEAVLTELRRIAERVDGLERSSRQGTERLAAVIDNASARSDRLNDQSRQRHAAQQRRGVTP